ncbi:hypothetical protein GIB67_039952 [Kingdonia uniflora]|uniref:Disease resistance R13L4/SHOC-2-like LRR domain-containing protein n=1 Tax=Kingdonia uniflora TaxID=39325 RepID=A0A7J7P3J3_9MAGN|nr:hypothetical protein GIB67_039952 [Kingdonia uniflora]
MYSTPMDFTNSTSLAKESLFLDFNATGNLLGDASLSRGAILLAKAEQKQIPNDAHKMVKLGYIEVEDGKNFKGLRAQENLEYLSLQGISRITKLPASIGKPTNLRILDLRACNNLLRSLPSEIISLKMLTHLNVSEYYLLEYMHKGLELLLELQVLKGFVIGNIRVADSCKLCELAKLDKLRKLSIFARVDAIVEEENLDGLWQFGALRVLTIT